MQMPVRKNKEKANRSLVVLWNNTKPLIKDFHNNYSYYVSFEKKGATAGNHYHNKKHEIIHLLVGECTVLLENIKTKEKEKFTLSAQTHNCISILPGIAHAVTANTDNAVIVVLANSPSTEDDEIAYMLKY